jgi:hypothetical protein
VIGSVLALSVLASLIFKPRPEDSGTAV